jgi:hypothetical protein
VKLGNATGKKMMTQKELENWGNWTQFPPDTPSLCPLICNLEVGPEDRDLISTEPAPHGTLEAKESWSWGGTLRPTNKQSKL